MLEQHSPIDCKSESVDDETRVKAWVTRVFDDTIEFSYCDEDGQFWMAEMPLETYMSYGLKGYEEEAFDIRIPISGTSELDLLPKSDSDARYESHLTSKKEEEANEPPKPTDWHNPTQVEAYIAALKTKYAGANWGRGAREET